MTPTAPRVISRGLLFALSLALAVTAAIAPTLAFAAIGDACVDGVCPAGETCIPDDVEGDFCTARCPEAGCPDGLVCRQGGAPFPMCLRLAREELLANFGEDCLMHEDCEPELQCLTDGEMRYCSRHCTVPGTCPEGFRCTVGAQRSCQRLQGAPASFEPCGAGGLCAAGFDCVTHASRTQPLCVFPCPDGICGEGQACVDGHCFQNPLPSKPAFGELCVADGAEPSLVGCLNPMHRCLMDGQSSYCTQGCNSAERCLMGYGCISVDPEATLGECRRGVPDDYQYVLPPDFGLPVFPPPMEPPSSSETDGGGPSSGGGGVPGEGSCAFGKGDRGLPYGLLVFAGLSVLAAGRRRRS